MSEGFLNRLFKRPRKAHVPEDFTNEEIVMPRIMACVGPEESFDREAREQLERLRAEELDLRAVGKVGVLTAGKNTYVISGVSSENKKSEGYKNCTGVAVVGVDRTTKKRVSLLTHQYPSEVLRWNRDPFVHHLKERLQEFVERAMPGSIDAVIFGGSYRDEAVMAAHTAEEKRIQERGGTVDISALLRNVFPKDAKGSANEDYRDSIVLLRSCIFDTLHREPRVVIGPNVMPNTKVDVWLDTQHARLYIMRPEQASSHYDRGFASARLEAQLDEWGKKNA